MKQKMNVLGQIFVVLIWLSVSSCKLHQDDSKTKEQTIEGDSSLETLQGKEGGGMPDQQILVSMIHKIFESKNEERVYTDEITNKGNEMRKNCLISLSAIHQDRWPPFLKSKFGQFMHCAMLKTRACLVKSFQRHNDSPNINLYLVEEEFQESLVQCSKGQTEDDEKILKKEAVFEGYDVKNPDLLKDNDFKDFFARVVQGKIKIDDNLGERAIQAICLQNKDEQSPSNKADQSLKAYCNNFGANKRTLNSNQSGAP